MKYPNLTFKTFQKTKNKCLTKLEEFYWIGCNKFVWNICGKEKHFIQLNITQMLI